MTSEIDARPLENAVISGLPWYNKWPLVTGGIGAIAGMFGYWAMQKAYTQFTKKAIDEQNL